MRVKGSRELQQAWDAFQASDQAPGTHVGTLEAMHVIREASGGVQTKGREAAGADRTLELGRFLDWLLYIRKDKILAYELLRLEGTLNVGPRQYWATKQGGKRAIAWESRYTYPGTDSEIWDVIAVDEA